MPPEQEQTARPEGIVSSRSIDGPAGSSVGQQAQPGGIVALQQVAEGAGFAGQAAAFPTLGQQETRTAMQAIQAVILLGAREGRTV